GSAARQCAGHTHQTKRLIMTLSFNFTHSFSDKADEHGLGPQDLDYLKPRVLDALREMRARRAAGKLEFLDLPYDAGAYTTCVQAAASFAGVENLVIAGIGGSALGPAAIFSALCHPLHNLLDAKARGGAPRFFVVDNVDPDHAMACFDFCDPRETVFNIISKSGATAETAAATLIVFDRLKKKLGAKWRDHMVCTTDPTSGDLRKLCEKEKLPTLDLPTGVGGRFSVLTPVGLFPAFLLGVDGEAMLVGAGEMAEQCLSDDFARNPAAKLAAMLYLFDTSYGKPIHVMMAYANSLYTMADWFRQLWAESLGKAVTLDGKTVNTGPIPVKALGTTDQHSQVQLYIEGPFDKVFLFLEVKEFEHTLKLPALYRNVSSLGYLGGQTMNKLMAAEFAATREALARNHRPSLTITFPRVDARAIGEFFMLFEIVTALCGHLYHINPFDQPGVELGKQLTYGLMGRKGFEEKAKGITR
ncbi:glucose-6-phosphate isomerase, partial [bacterium]|nr:glucose-6-phosphate isomerase [bacterium]